MCGRLNITDDPLAKMVTDALGISFSPLANDDLRPTQIVNCIGVVENSPVQLDLPWGIKPHWAKQLIINAQSETVATKPTFKKAFATSRCVVPCSGWYEWKQIGSGKQKYLFTSNSPLYMAGINIDGYLVTLTTQPNEQCAEYHHRMPQLLPKDGLLSWMSGTERDAASLLLPCSQELMVVPK